MPIAMWTTTDAYHVAVRFVDGARVELEVEPAASRMCIDALSNGKHLAISDVIASPEQVLLQLTGSNATYLLYAAEVVYDPTTARRGSWWSQPAHTAHR